jgi:hypothetical protein
VGVQPGSSRVVVLDAERSMVKKVPIHKDHACSGPRGRRAARRGRPGARPRTGPRSRRRRRTRPRAPPAFQRPLDHGDPRPAWAAKGNETLVNSPSATRTRAPSGTAAATSPTSAETNPPTAIRSTGTRAGRRRRRAQRRLPGQNQRAARPPAARPRPHRPRRPPRGQVERQCSRCSGSRRGRRTAGRTHCARCRTIARAKLSPFPLPARTPLNVVLVARP